MSGHVRLNVEALRKLLHARVDEVCDKRAEAVEAAAQRQAEGGQFKTVPTEDAYDFTLRLTGLEVWAHGVLYREPEQPPPEAA